MSSSTIVLDKWPEMHGLLADSPGDMDLISWVNQPLFRVMLS